MTTEKDWRYLTTKELSKLLDVTTQTIIRWRLDKELPAKKFPSRKLEFNIFEVLDWLESQTQIDERRFDIYYPYKLAVIKYINNREARLWK